MVRSHDESSGTQAAQPAVMPHDPVFDSTENQAPLVVCARKAIRTAAIAGIVWGIINLLIGYTAVRVNVLNLGILGLSVQCSRRELWHWLDRRYTCC